ncbi:hypothetical protein [Polaromonas sp. UC242_47]|uniref:hypothetical protein n=1 Tax=Polaromonas sp. UC242_47 TaxID=3374626 RepID=UPI0037A6D0E3
MEDRTAITTPLWMKFCIAAIVAALLTLVALSISWGGMAPVAGKPIAVGALLVLPLVIAAKYDWSATASVMLTFFTYFALSVGAVLALMRER